MTLLFLFFKHINFQASILALCSLESVDRYSDISNPSIRNTIHNQQNSVLLSQFKPVQYATLIANITKSASELLSHSDVVRTQHPHLKHLNNAKSLSADQTLLACLQIAGLQIKGLEKGLCTVR